ncbi:chaperone protein DNAj, putative [Trypanosoma equiperdum]|uniref:Chaperone protein DNAj, putative n=1 Tax=Trypanosoma equiperdum TaxID=5694 RepID=A0A1G4I055_TRYEQ|nr:chaperone protein DNAj, putative [Trypanosoma equiperdum]
MEDAKYRTFPAKVLLACDERIHQFIDASIYNDWNAAVQEWREQKQARVSLQRQKPPEPKGEYAPGNKLTQFSDEEFLKLTQQLEEITSAIAGPSAALPGPTFSDGGDGAGSNDCCHSGAKHDLYTLDSSMYSASLDDKQLSLCQKAAELYKVGDYSEAARNFSAVIDSCLPTVLNAAMVSNRAMCYLCCGSYRCSLRDAIRSCEMNNQYVLGARRAVRIHICCGKCSEARGLIDTYSKTCGHGFEEELANITLYENSTALFDRNEHATALKQLNELLKRAPCAPFEALKVQLVAVELGSRAALLHAEECLRRYPNFPELMYWNVQLRFLECSNESELVAILSLSRVSASADCAARFRQVNSRIQQCIDLCRELEKTSAAKNWPQLVELCTKALQRPFIGDRLRAAVLSQRAQALYHSSRLYECVDDLDVALRNVEGVRDRAELLLLKALCEEKLSRWTDAMHSVERSMREERLPAAVDMWRRLKGRKKTSDQRERQGEKKEEERKWTKPVAPTSLAQLYSRLALPDGAGAEKVRKSYRALAMKWHPDKWCSASAQEQKEAEEKFKLVKAAYDQLIGIIVD